MPYKISLCSLQDGRSSLAQQYCNKQIMLDGVIVIEETRFFRTSIGVHGHVSQIVCWRHLLSGTGQHAEYTQTHTLHRQRWRPVRSYL